jgi:hypothetical protein
MPTLYEASKSLRKLPDSVYGTSRKLASISLSKMAANMPTSEEMNIPSGVVIYAEELERKVKIFLIKINSIGTYLSQLPKKTRNEPEGLEGQNLEGQNLEGQFNQVATGSGRRRRMRGGADEQDDADALIAELDKEMEELEELIHRIPVASSLDGSSSGDDLSGLDTETIEEDLESVAEVAEEVYDTAMKTGNKKLIGLAEDLRDAVNEGDKNAVNDILEEIKDQLSGGLDVFGHTQSVQKDIGISNKLISFSSLFGKASQSVDDAQIYFNENIAPYKNSLTAVQIENMNRDLDNISVMFQSIIQSPTLLALTSKQQSFEPYDQLIKSFGEFRKSVRGVINSSISNPPPENALTGAGRRTLSHHQRHSRHSRQNAPSLSILGRYKNCPQKYLL